MRSRTVSALAHMIITAKEMKRERELLVIRNIAGQLLPANVSALSV